MVLRQILKRAARRDTMLVQEGIHLEPVLKAEEPPHLRVGEISRAVVFQRHRVQRHELSAARCFSPQEQSCGSSSRRTTSRSTACPPTELRPMQHVGIQCGSW